MSAPAPAMPDPLERFAQAIADADLPVPDSIIGDGRVHRYSTNGHASDDAGWYVLHLDGIPAGAFGCWRAGISDTWCSQRIETLTPAEREVHRRRIEAARRNAEAERAAVQESAAQQARNLWAGAAIERGGHEYLLRKGIDAHGLRTDGKRLLVPMRDAGGGLHNVQRIESDGEKRFLPGGRVSGLYFVIGKPDATLCVTEGYATGASVYEATDHAVAIAFSASNLRPVAEALRSKLGSDVRIIIAADNDESGVGQRAAEDAARAVGGLVAIPQDAGRDWNDVYAASGAEAVCSGIEAARGPEAVPVSFQDEIERLAKMTPIEYDRVRVDCAKALKIRVTTLDNEVEHARPKPEGSDAKAGQAVEFSAIEPWAEPVEPCAVLNELTASVHRFVMLGEHEAVAVALWVVQAHAHDLRNISPILAVTSPEKRCGKTTLLDLLSLLVPKPLPASNISAPALFRSVEKYHPTLLVDEADTFLRNSNELRGVLNSGHQRNGAWVIRTAGDDFEPRIFGTWSPKVIALIGKLHDTLVDRSIEIRLQRRLPSERIERLRDRAAPALKKVARRVARLVADNGPRIRDAEPNLPANLHDRAADNWEPLLAVADLAGPEWGRRAREAARALSSNAEDESSLTLLLGDLRLMFQGAKHLATSVILDKLHAMDERPWSEWKSGKPISARGLASLLRRVRVKPHTMRIGSDTPKGYVAADLEDAFCRYLPSLSATSATSLNLKENTVILSATSAENVADKNVRKSFGNKRVADVADTPQDAGGEHHSGCSADDYRQSAEGVGGTAPPPQSEREATEL